MTDVFISYSRKDGEFMRLLHGKLQAAQRDVWVDWEDIPATADWWAEIKSAIEAADAFAFIISSNSVRSEVCYREIQHAIDNNKRFIPLLFTEISDDDAPHVHPAIRSHNWIPFSDSAKYEESMQKLLDALSTDPDYLRRHTRLLVRAREWVQHERHNSYLLKGAELGEYQNWLEESQIRQPKPTELHLEYVLASQQYRARNQMRFALTIIVAVIIFAVMVAVALLQSQRLRETASLSTIAAQEQLSTSQAQQVTSQAQETQIAAQATNIANIRSDSQNLITQAYIQNTLAALQTENAGLVMTISAFQASPTQVATSLPATLPNTGGGDSGEEPAMVETAEEEDDSGDSGVEPDTATPSFVPAPTQDAQAQGVPSPTNPPQIRPTGQPPHPEELLEDYYVQPFGRDEADCRSPMSACQTIQAAIDKASDGESIGIAPGVYETTIVIDKSIRLNGLNTESTVINGNFVDTVIIVLDDAEVEISNLTITGGAAAFGGGILNFGNLSLSHVLITGNFADLSGGAIANFGTMTMQETQLDVNYAPVIAEIYTSADSETVFNGESLAPIGQVGEIGPDVLVMINTTDGDNLRMRDEPGLNTNIIARIPPETPAIVIGGSENVDGFVWWLVYVPTGEVGWVVEWIDDIQVLTVIE
jgi:hypothetical protein